MLVQCKKFIGGLRSCQFTTQDSGTNTFPHFAYRYNIVDEKTGRALSVGKGVGLLQAPSIEWFIE